MSGGVSGAVEQDLIAAFKRAKTPPQTPVQPEIPKPGTPKPGTQKPEPPKPGPPKPGHPTLFERLWPVYLTLRGQTAQGCAGPNPVSLSDMEAYARTFDAGFVAWQRLLVLEADALYLAAVAGIQEKRAQNNGPQNNGPHKNGPHKNQQHTLNF